MIRDELEPNGYLKYGPDAYVILTSYAALTLLKVRKWILPRVSLLSIDGVIPYISFTASTAHLF